jgi:radical SAM superfamily enzyme YgiQ (UPF0313 family)
MRILLIKPPISPHISTISIYEPLELEYLAASVPGHVVQILDMRIDQNLMRTLQNFKPDIAGLTSYTCDVNTVNRICSEIKKYDASIRTIVGGNHATFMPSDFHTGNIDAIFLGYADSTFRQYIDKSGESEDLEGIPNLCIRNGSKYHFTEKQSCAVNLNILPFPARELTRKYWNKYHDSFRNKISLLMTSRGCPFRCTFCACWKLMDGKYVTRNVDSIIDEFKSLDEDRRIIYFSDDNTLDNIKRSWELADSLKKSGINRYFHLYARVDTIVKHPDLFTRLKEAGLFSVTVGIESIRDDELQKINKKTSVEMNTEAIHILKQQKININPHFIIRPEYRSRDFDELFNYVNRNNLFKPVYAVLTPLPGTELFNATKDQFVLHNYDFFDFAHSVLPTSLSRKEFYSQLFKLYRRSYSIWRLFKFKLVSRFSNTNKPYGNTDDITIFRLILINLFGLKQALKIKNAYRTES